MEIVLISVDMTGAEGGGFVYRFCSHSHDIVHNSYTYTAAGGLISMEDVELSADLTTIGLSLGLSGIDPAYHSEIENGGFKNAPVEVLIAEVPDGSNETTASQYYFRGTADTPNTEIDYGNGTITVNLSIQSPLRVLDKSPELMRTSQSSHEAYHPGDKFFKYVASTATEETWKS